MSSTHDLLKTTAGIVLGAIGLCVLVGILFYSEKIKVERSMIDQATLCPVVDAKNVWAVYSVHPPVIPRRTAFIIDATDRIPEPHRDLLVDWLRTEFTQSLERFEKVSIYEVRPREESAEPIIESPPFSKCAPPYDANIWFENPTLVRDKFEKEFMDGALTVVRALASQSPARWSPIVEAIERRFRDYDQIILLSDLMQHTPACSLYRRNPGNQCGAACLSRGRALLRGKHFHVLFLKRDRISSYQGVPLIEFWKSCVEGAGGTWTIDKALPPIK